MRKVASLVALNLFLGACSSEKEAVRAEPAKAATKQAVDTLDAIQDYLRNDNWLTPAVPDSAFTPGALVTVGAAAGGRPSYAFKTRLADCAKDAAAPMVSQGAAGIPTTSVSFTASGAAAVAFFGNSAAAEFSKVQSVSVKPSTLRTMTTSTGTMKQWAYANKEGFNRFCATDFAGTSEGPLVVTEALVAVDLDIALVDSAGAKVNLDVAALKKLLKVDVGASVEKKATGDFHVKDASLVFGFHAVPAKDVAAAAVAP